MFKRTVTADDLARLKREREEADPLYNQALAELDGALQRLREMPHPPPGYDEDHIGPLSEQWNLQAVRPHVGGWRGRVQSLVWSLVGPLFERQESFNSALVSHLNRNIPVQQGITASITSIVALPSQKN